MYTDTSDPPSTDISRPTMTLFLVMLLIALNTVAGYISSGASAEVRFNNHCVKKGPVLKA